MDKCICTFFGHRELEVNPEAALIDVLRRLVDECAVDTFYVGNEGRFDRLVQVALHRLQSEYPHLHCCVVLAYFPEKTPQLAAPLDTLYPDGLESAPRRFAIARRNRWMLQRSDYVVAYVAHSWGGAAQCCRTAQRLRKKVFNLADRAGATG